MNALVTLVLAPPTSGIWSGTHSSANKIVSRGLDHHVEGVLPRGTICSTLDRTAAMIRRRGTPTTASRTRRNPAYRQEDSFDIC